MTDWDNLTELYERVRPGFKDGGTSAPDSEAVGEVRRDGALERPTTDPELLLMRAVGVYSQAVDMDLSVLYGRTFTLRDCLDAVIAANAAAVERWRAGKD